MPSVAHEAPEGGSRITGGAPHAYKKRRWDDRGSVAAGGSGSSDVVAIYVHGSTAATTTATTTAAYTLNAHSPSQRKILPVSAKRLRLSSASGNDGRPTAHPPSNAQSPSKGGREQPSQHCHYQPPPAPSIAAMPCHICLRRPKRKSDLDSLANCEGCGSRTCFVCMRECPGWAGSEGRDATVHTPATDEHTTEPASDRLLPPWSAASRGHRRMICSRCCVERGEDGDVVCLSCAGLIDDRGHAGDSPKYRRA